MDRRKYSLPVSDLLSQHLEGLDKESDGTVKENSQPSTLAEPVSDCQNGEHNNESHSGPRNVRKEENSSVNGMPCVKNIKMLIEN